MKRKLNYFIVASMLLAGMSIQMACSSSKQVAKQSNTQPVVQPKKTVTKPPVNPFKNDTTQTKKPVVKKNITLSTVHFAFNKSNLDDPDAHLLAKNVELLRKDPQIDVRIDAYTDHIGSDQYNLRLSERRARTVKNFYENNGISGSRITARGLGKAPIPCYMNTPGPGCRKNRRAETHVVKPNQG